MEDWLAIQEKTDSDMAARGNWVSLGMAAPNEQIEWHKSWMGMQYLER